MFEKGNADSWMNRRPFSYNAESVRVASLSLRDFRNVAAAELAFGDGLNVLAGRNGQGKTTILEALHLLSAGRSHRTRDEREMVRFGAPLFRLDAALDDGATLGYGFARSGERAVDLAGARASPADLVGRLLVVLHTPDDGEVVRGAPLERRRAFDLELSRLDRAYFDTLRAYRHTLRQRNARLDRADPADDLLAVYDRRLADLGGALLHRMHAFVRAVSARAEAVYGSLPGAEGSFSIEHRASVPDPSRPPADLAADLYKRLESARSSDIVRGATSAGPHRDDFRFRIDGRDLRDYGSQGQVKSAALAFKLAVADHVRDAAGRTPVLLLDDLTSELDAGRLARFLDLVVGRGQVLLTTTLPEALGRRALDGARRFRVEGGRVDVEAA